MSALKSYLSVAASTLILFLFQQKLLHLSGRNIKLLQSLDQDLPDLTPRRFLRHSVTLAYLQKRCPAINNLSGDLHISLANREHVKTYILQVQKRCFPFGTGWKGMYGIVVGSCQLISFTGLCYLKANQATICRQNNITFGL